MEKTQNFKKAVVQIPLILGLASAAVAALLISQALIQDTSPQSPTDQIQPAQNGQIGQETTMEKLTINQGQVNQPMMQPNQVNQTERGIIPEKRIEINTGVVPEKRMTEPGIKEQPTLQTPQPIEKQEEYQEQEKPVDPREIQSVMQQFKDLRKEINNFLTQFKKLSNRTDETAQLNEAANLINTFEQNLKNPPADTSQREVIQEFYDARIWDTINEIRASFVDPKELQNVTRQFKDMRKEIKNFLIKLKKLPNLADEKTLLNEISNQINTFEKDLNNPPTDMTQREVLQEFYDAQLWDTINEVRMKIELPNRIKDIEKQITSVEKLLKQKAYQKIKLLDLNAIKTTIDEMKSAVADAKNKYQTGEMEDAMETLNDIFSDVYPGDINCVLNSFRDLNQNFPKIKDAEIKAAIQEIIDPIIAAAKEGAYREACQSFNEVRPELWKVMQYAYKVRKTVDPQMTQKIQKLQGLIEQKFGTEAPEEIPQE